MNCPGSIWLEKKCNRDDLQVHEGFAWFCSFWSLQHIFAFRWHSSPVSCVFLAHTALGYHIHRSKMRATLTWDKGSDLTQSRSWNNRGCLLPAALKKTLCIAHADFLFPLPSWMVPWTGCNTVQIWCGITPPLDSVLHNSGSDFFAVHVSVYLCLCANCLKTRC